MANTAALLELIEEFGSAFANPEFPVTAPANDAVAGEEEQAEEHSADNAAECFDIEGDSEDCYFYLSQLEHEPKLVAIAADFLEQLAAVASLKQQLHNAPVMKTFQDAVDNTDSKLGDVLRAKMSEPFLDLPETFARQGTPECPGGLCSL